jgi:hypothetical protein
VPLGLVEVILFFGVVLVWSWIEYRKADRLSKSHKPPDSNRELSQESENDST